MGVRLLPALLPAGAGVDFTSTSEDLTVLGSSGSTYSGDTDDTGMLA